MQKEIPTVTQRRQFVCRALPALKLALVLGLMLSTGCGPGLNYTPARLDAEPDDYRSVLRTQESAVQVEKLPAGLRCVVVSNGDPEKTHSGGIMLPAKGTKAFSLDLKFVDPEGIVVVFVDACNARNQSVARWHTEHWAKLPRSKATYEFIPQKGTKGFKPGTSSGSGEIESIHVFVAVQRGYGVIFEITNLELAR